jgi:hypothetical protein
MSNYGFRISINFFFFRVIISPGKVEVRWRK